jgi:predicted DNA-binding WGR domain protein
MSEKQLTLPFPEPWQDPSAVWRRVVLRSEDPARNRHRQYEVELCRSLFGDIGVRRSWGPIGRAGLQSRTTWYPDQHSAKKEFFKTVYGKVQRGYKP